MSIDGIKKQIFTAKTAETTGTGGTLTTKETETVESKEMQELAEAKTDENSLADIEEDETSEKKGGLLKRAVDNVDKAYNESDSAIKSLAAGSWLYSEKVADKIENTAGKVVEGAKDVWENDTTTGRMISKNENFVEAFVNGYKSASTRIRNFFKGLFSKK